MKILPISVLILLTLPPCFAQNLKELGLQNLEKDSRFGQAVELTGNTAFISAPTREVNGQSQHGSVFIFEKGTDWQHAHTLTHPDGRPYDKFGYSVSANGDMMAVGAPGKGSGAVYIYVRESNEWVNTQILYPHIPGDQYFNSMLFGSAVKMTDGFLFVTAPEYLKSASDVQASVFVFKWVLDEWVFSQRLSHPDDQNSSLFGHAIDATNEMLLIGSPKSDGGADESGAAFLYELSNDEWKPSFTFIYDLSKQNERFGFSVGIDEERVIIGSPMHVFDESEGPVGTAHIYVRAGSTWFHTGSLKSEFSERNEQFGERVSIQGDLAIIAAGRTSHSTHTNAGSIHLFKLEHGFWNEIYQLAPDSGKVQSHMYFGSSFDFDDKHVLVGSHLEDNTLDDSGNAYVHELETTVSASGPNDNGYALYSISPNPFNEQAVITFDIPLNTDVVIDAFNVNGVFVERIAEKYLPAGVGHSVIWKPEKLLPGTYFIRLKAGGKVSIAKASFIQ